MLLERVYPRPDLVIYLDASGRVLYAHKGEETIKVLERYRQRYLQLRHLVEHFVVIEATLPEDEIWDSVVKNITDFSQCPASHNWSCSG